MGYYFLQNTTDALVGEFGLPTIGLPFKSSGGCIFKEMLLLFLTSSIIFLDLRACGNT